MITAPKLPDLIFCAECGKAFYTTDSRKEFCTPACALRAKNRATAAGARLYRAVMAWRINRPHDALSDLTQLADYYAGEERAIRAHRDARIAEQLASGIKGKLRRSDVVDVKVFMPPKPVCVMQDMTGQPRGKRTRA